MSLAPADILIPPASARALLVARGQTLRVTDIEGSQVADFVCFDAHDHGHVFSQGKTRMNAWRLRISSGDPLYSNLNAVLFRIGEDKVKVHDLLFAPCNRFLYETVFAVPDHDGCLESLARALAPYGIAKGAVPDPFNLFMNTSVDAEQALRIHAPRSRAGDYVELVAERDCLVAVSACAADITECNGGRCTPIALSLRD